MDAEEQRTAQTDRSALREHEDRTSTPVIIKRWDQAVRHPDDTLQHAIEEGEAQSQRSALSLFLSSLAAGSILVFTAMAVGVAGLYAYEIENTFLTRLVLAAVYPLGFVVCIMSGTQLFTEHTALAVYPVLERRVRKRRLLRTWGIVLVGNYVGCAIGAGLLAAAEPVVGAGDGYAEVVTRLLGYETVPLFLSALLAGWLMALGGWLVLSSMPGLSQMVGIYIVTFLIGLGHLHHSVALAAELFVALFTGAEIGLVEAAWTLGVVIVGNLVGGAVFVAVLNYGHIRKAEDGEGAA